VDNPDAASTASASWSHTARDWAHSGQEKLITPSALDDIFGTPHAPASHQADNSPPVLINSGDADGAISITSKIPSDIATALEKLYHHAAAAFAESGVTGSLDANHSEAHPHATQIQTHPAAQVGLTAEGDDSAGATFGASVDDDQARMATPGPMQPVLDTQTGTIAANAGLTGSNVANFVEVGTDRFIFEPGLGDQPPRGLMFADSFDVQHHLHLSIPELHAELLAAARESASAIASDAHSADQVATPTLHFHDSHLL
jgi:hypothetical protein